MKPGLYEHVVHRVEGMTQVCRDSFGKTQKRLVSQIYEAMEKSNNELDTLGLISGVLITEKVSDYAIEKAMDSIRADPMFSELEDRDLEELARYFVDQNAGSLVFAPEVLSAFFKFAIDVGFPVTFGGAEKGGLSAPRYDTKTLLRVLVGAHVLTVVEVPAVDARDAKHSSDEENLFKENPKVKVDVYEYDEGFLKELSHVLRILGVKEEGIKRVSFLKLIEDKRGNDMKPSITLDQLDQRLKELVSEADKKPEPKESPEEEPADSSDKEHESNFFKQLSDETVEKFVDGILLVLGELEQTGVIDKIASPDQARDAVLAAIRRLYQKRGLVSKMSRQYARFGAKRVLRKAKQDINKALS